MNTTRKWFLLILVAVWCFCGFAGAPVGHAQENVAIGAAEARITYLQGSARNIDTRSGRETDLALGSTLRQGDEVVTKENARLELSLADGTRLRFAENTRFRVETILCDEGSKRRTAKIRVLLGRTWAKVYKMWDANPGVLFSTEFMVAAVRGTTYRLNVEQTRETLVRVYEGEVGVSNSEEGASSGKDAPFALTRPTVIEGPKKVTMEEWVYIIKAMYEIQISREGVPAQPKPFTAEEDRDEWVTWNRERDAIPVRSEPPGPPAGGVAVPGPAPPALKGPASATPAAPEARTTSPRPGDAADAASRKQTDPDRKASETEKTASGAQAGDSPKPASLKEKVEEAGFFERLFGSSKKKSSDAADVDAAPKFSGTATPSTIDLTDPNTLNFRFTLAVLPLENLSRKDDLAWLSEGIPESMIAKLQNVRRIHMVERMRIRAILEELKLGMAGFVDSKSVQEAGKLLGADTVLVGSYAEFRGEVRITLRLVQVETGSLIHALEETGLIDRIFQLQDRLAERLVAALGLPLASDENRRMALAATSSLQAYQFYVRGRDQYFRFNREGYEKAVELYREAIRLDPGYVLAHAGIGDALATLAYSRRQAGESYEGILRQGQEAAEKAISLNPSSSEAHRALAHVHNNAFRFRDARWEAEKALALNPNDSESWYLLGQAATTVPDLDRAELCYQNALRLDPRYAMAYNSLGWYVYLERKWYDKAVEAFKRAIQFSPDFTNAHDSLGEAYFRQEKYEEAAASFKKVLELQPGHKNATKRYREAVNKLGKQ